MSVKFEAGKLYQTIETVAVARLDISESLQSTPDQVNWVLSGDIKYIPRGEAVLCLGFLPHKVLSLRGSTAFPKPVILYDEKVWLVRNSAEWNKKSFVHLNLDYLSLDK